MFPFLVFSDQRPFMLSFPSGGESTSLYVLAFPIFEWLHELFAVFAEPPLSAPFDIKIHNSEMSHSSIIHRPPATTAARARASVCGWDGGRLHVLHVLHDSCSWPQRAFMIHSIHDPYYCSRFGVQ